MMKIPVALTSLLILYIPAATQTNLPFNGVAVEYLQIDSGLNASKSELYKRSGEWFASAFKSANNVIQYSDPESGKIIGKGVHIFDARKGGVIGEITCRFTIEITARENKYRTRITDLLLTNSSSSFVDKPIESVIKEDVEKGMMKKYFAEVVSKCDQRMKEILASIQAKMKEASSDNF